MAERRMFAKAIIDSDAFLDMPISAQLLYFHLGMRADDDGFVNSPRKIQRMVGCAADDLKLLAAKRFIIIFPTGVIVIKHWRVHNYLRKDRYKPTRYQDEMRMLKVKVNGSYTERVPVDNSLGPPPAEKLSTGENPVIATDIEDWQPNGNQMATTGIPTGNPGKVRIGKDSIGEVKFKETSKEKTERPAPPLPDRYQRNLDRMREQAGRADEEWQKMEEEEKMGAKR